MDEGRKRVIGIMAAILASQKLAEFRPAKKVPATITATSGLPRDRMASIYRPFSGGDPQSAFSDSVGRMQCDHKPTMRRKRLGLSMLPTSPFLDN
jgi:hypothetical protein